MSNFVTKLLFAALAALGVYAARRRIVFALKTGAIVYLGLEFTRLLFSLLTGGAKSEPIGEFVIPVLVIFGAWLILSKVSTRYAVRRDREKQLQREALRQERLRRATGAGRGAR